MLMFVNTSDTSATGTIRVSFELLNKTSEKYFLLKEKITPCMKPQRNFFEIS